MQEPVRVDDRTIDRELLHFVMRTPKWFFGSSFALSIFLLAGVFVVLHLVDKEPFDGLKGKSQAKDREPHRSAGKQSQAEQLLYTFTLLDRIHRNNRISNPARKEIE